MGSYWPFIPSLRGFYFPESLTNAPPNHHDRETPSRVYPASHNLPSVQGRTLRGRADIGGGFPVFRRLASRLQRQHGRRRKDLLVSEVSKQSLKPTHTKGTANAMQHAAETTTNVKTR